MLERTEVGRMPGDFSGQEYFFPNRGSVRAFRGSISRDLLNR